MGLKDDGFYRAFCCCNCKYFERQCCRFKLFDSEGLSMWFHKVSLCRVCIWVCVETISKSDTRKGIVLRGGGNIWRKRRICMQWETKAEKGSNLQLQAYNLQWPWMRVTRVRCLFISKSSQPEALFSHFSKPLVLCLPLLCRISGQVIADVYLWKRNSYNRFEP